MKIAVIGAGAMGSIYGGHLSLANEVYLIDKNRAVVDAIQTNGLMLEENGGENRYTPEARTDCEGVGEVDLVILFVKALFSRAALAENKALIGPNTYLLTLQNGAGHEEILAEAAPMERVIIGTTEDNGAPLALGRVRHGGTGRTNLGMLRPDTAGMLGRLKETFDACGFDVCLHDNIQQLIWNKLFTNVSLSAVTGVLQVEMGYIAGNDHAWALTRQLLHEAVAVAGSLGLEVDEEALLCEIRAVSENNPHGCTSIYTDIKNGRRTEVDTISGAVVRAARKQGVPVPAHEFLVHMVHALEGKNA